MSIIMIRTLKVGNPNLLESQTQKKNKLSLNWEDAYTFKLHINNSLQGMIMHVK